MVRRDGAGEPGRAAAHHVHRFLGGEVLQDHAQAGKRREKRRQRAVDEHALAVEHIDAVARVLPVHQERHADLFHAREHGIDLADIGDARGGIRGGVRRVELRAREYAVAEPVLEIVRIGRVGEIAGHQRRERRAGGKRRHDALAIGDRVRGGGDRRHQIRHHDRAGEMPRRERQHGRQHGAVAHMQVPVVRPANGDALRHFQRSSGGPRLFYPDRKGRGKPRLCNDWSAAFERASDSPPVRTAHRSTAHRSNEAAWQGDRPVLP